MKKIIFICVAFLTVSIPGFAQQFLNIYQDKVVIKQISTEEIDSMSVVEAEPRIISMWKGGEVFLTYTSAEIDSITVTNQGGDPLSYIGIVGFNDQLYKKEIGILSKSTASEYKSFVNSLPRKDGTLLYYAVDNALDMLDNANIETPLKNVNLITFTDGLDQGSLMITDKYGSSTDYLNAMSNRIARTKVSGHSVNAFSVGLRGKDVTNETLFKQNLQRLASSSNNAFEVSTISELRERLREIANQIISVSNRQTMSVKIPGIDSGTRIRFDFDGKSAENSSLYIEGTFNLQDRSLHDVTYHGLKATSGKTVQGTQDGIFVRYTFTGMRLESGDGLIPTSSVKHYYRLPSSSSWQLNSEFTPASDTQTSISHSGTSIFLVLDCSSSLGSDFSRMQQYANEFIDMLADKAEPFKLVAPTNVKATLDDNDLIVHISWDAVKYAQSYNVYRSNSSSYYADYELVAENVTATTWTDNNPLEGNNYYRVCAVNRNNLSSQSSSASVNVKLDTPTNVKVEMGVKNEQLVVNISWDAVKYAQSYNVYRNGSLVAEKVTSTTWTDSSPLSGNNNYRVCAVNRNNLSSQSSSASVNIKLDAPTNVKATIDENDLIVHISWDAVKYAQNYNVYRNSDSYGTYELVAEKTTSTTWTDSSPLSGYNYYKVCAVGYGLTSSQSSYADVNVKLDAPTNVKAAVDDNDLVVNVSWDAVKRAQSYNVYRSSYNGSYELVAENVSSTVWTDSNPLNGNNYYKICAVNREISSYQSSYASVNVKIDAPTNLKAEMVVKSNRLVVSLSWDAVKYAQNYSVYRKGNSGDYELMAENLTSTTWTDNSPLSGYNYYKVCAIGYGFTNSIYASVNVKLDVPTNVKATIDDNDLVVNVTWDAVNFAQNYNVYRNSSSSGTYGLVAENITATTWTDNSPLSGSNYYKVCAVGYGLTSSQSSYASVSNVKLDAPTNVKATLDDNDLVVNVLWNAVQRAQSYKVYRSSSSSGTYGLMAENITATTWTDNSPLSGSNYYKICAINRNITSSQSSYADVNVKLDAPTNVKAEMNLKNEKFVVNVSWNAVKRTQSYNVYRNSSSGGTYGLVAENITATTWTDNSPLSGSNYYKICAVNREISSSQSSYASVNVKLDAPTNVKAEMEVKNETFVVNVSWDAVKYAQSYSIYRKGGSGDYELMAENITGITWTDSSPLSGYNYYKVCAVGYGLTSSQSSYASVNVKLDAPTNVKAAIDDNDLVVNVSWNAVKFAQSYRVYRCSKYNGTYELVAENVTSTTWTDSCPLSGSNYYKVCAVGYGLTSSQSSYASVNVKLDTPTNVKAAIDDNDLIVHVSWNAVQRAQSYNVYRSSYNGSYELVAEKVTSNSWTDISPLSGSHYYKICAINRNITSSQSSYAYVNNVKLDAPTNVKAEIDDSDLKICIFWDAVKYAQSYQIYRSSSSSGTYELVAENITETTWKDDNSFIGFNYYKVCAVNRNITSSQSDAASAYYVPEAKTAIDLGLPSGTLWASCNVGATKPEEYGNYFAWGETQPKENYSWSTYKWCKGSSSTMTKYCNKSSYGNNGFTDNKTELDFEDDAAYVNWGSNWRMPSTEQIQELIDNCNWEWTTLNGVYGRKATSKKNGKSIFLPAAGYRDVTSLYGAGSWGYYWSRTLYTGSAYSACRLYFYSGNVYWSSDYRYCGQSVRPVQMK